MSAYNAYGEQPAWSGSSYGLRTHSVPAVVVAAVATATLYTKNLTLAWTPPATEGSGDCKGSAYVKVIDLSSSTETCITKGTGSAVSGYVVYKLVGSTWTAIAGGTVSTLTATTFVVTGLSAATVYQFKVTATNAIGTSVLASTIAVSATTLGVPSTPNAATATLVDEDSITLKWTVPTTSSPIVSYRMFAASYNAGTSAWEPALRASLSNDTYWTTTGTGSGSSPYKTTSAVFNFKERPSASALPNKLLYNTRVSTKCTTFAMSIAECDLAAAALGLVDVTSANDGLSTQSSAPKGCYLEGSTLKFNTAADNTGSCSSGKTCVCKDGAIHWLEIKAQTTGPFVYATAAAAQTLKIQHLAPLTQYRFAMTFTNEAGESISGPNSLTFKTLDEPITTMRVFAGAPCVFKHINLKTESKCITAPTTIAACGAAAAELGLVDVTAANDGLTGQSSAPKGCYLDGTTLKFNSAADNTGSCSTTKKCVCSDSKPVSFQVSAVGSNKKFRWEAGAKGSGVSGHTKGSKVGTCKNADCSEMEYRFIHEGDHKISAVGWNSRGMKRITTEYSVQRCGCTDAFDANYDEHAKYHLPLECANRETWSDAVFSLRVDELEYLQYYYEPNTHSVKITLRVDSGKVAIYVSTNGVPDTNRADTYLASPISHTAGVSNFLVVTIPYSKMHGSSGGNSVYIAVRGLASTYKFNTVTTAVQRSDFQIMVERSDFGDTRTTLANNVAAPATDLKTSRYKFYEFMPAKAANDVDVDVTVAVTKGSVKLYSSLTERYPSPLRVTAASSNGYWQATDTVAAGSSKTLSLTVKPEASPRRIALAVRGIVAGGAIVGASTGTRHARIGDNIGLSSYTITARLYRYTINSDLLETKGGAASADRRYTVVKKGEFEYFQVKLSASSASLIIKTELYHGTVQLYYSDTKLPTRDASIGYTKTYPNPSDTAIKWSGRMPQSMSFAVTLADVAQRNVPVPKTIYIGVYGTSDVPAAYKLTATETALPATVTPLAYSTAASTSHSIALSAGVYKFFALQVGPQDVAMMVGQRDKAGARTASLTSASDSWGTDWSELATKATWKDIKWDELDTDVKVTATVSASNVKVYGSSFESYTSAQRGWGATNVVGSTTSIVVNHYTFSGKNLVYIGLNSASSQTITLTLAKADLAAAASSTTATTKKTCTGYASCSQHGHCINDMCICDEYWSGAKCDVRSFGNSVTGTPDLLFTAGWPGALSPFDGAVAFDVPFEARNAPAYSKAYVYIDGLAYPSNSSNIVHMPAAGTPASGAATYNKIKILGLKTGATHTALVTLVSDRGVVLDSAKINFLVTARGGCKNGCGGKGVCHNDYCVCFDGWMGTACATADNTEGSSCSVVGGVEVCTKSYTALPSGFKAGAAYSAARLLNTSLAVAKSKYINELALAANTALLAREKAEVLANKTYINSRLVAKGAARATALTNAASALVTSVDTVHRKLDRFATALQQTRAESTRAQTQNLEQHLNTQRSLFAHQTKIQNNLDKLRAATSTSMAASAATLAKELAINEFNINTVKTANGPRVKITDLKTEACTTDQRGRVTCTKTSASSSFTADAANDASTPR